MKIKIVLIFMIFICSCGNKDSITASKAEQTFYYKSYDLNHNLIVHGWLEIKFSNSDEISGTWNLQKVGNPEDIGPQVGTGELIGGLTNKDSIWIELNPEYIDNNLQLCGKYKISTITGKWIWSSYAGITNQGYFNAVLK
jgi:hypothetical protein